MQRKEIVALLMESPFYLETPLRERLQILKYNENRFINTNFHDGFVRKIDQTISSVHVISTNSPLVKMSWTTFALFSRR